MKKTQSQKLPRGFGRFSFSDDASRKALVDTLAHRPMGYIRRPLVVISGPPGSGKTLLARQIMKHHGVNGPSIMPVSGDEEMRRTIPLLLDKKYVCFDDVRKLGGATLPAFITSHQWSYRKLYSSQMETKAVRTRVIVTGVDVALSADLERRARRINLAGISS